VNIPLYQGGATHAQVRQAKHTHVGRIQDIEQARAVAQAGVVQTWSQLEASKAQLVSDQAQVDATRTALTGVREEEKVGQRTLLDVLNAEQELLNAEVNLVTTKRNLVVASYAVLSSVGRLNVADLGSTSTAYDAEAHYHEVRSKWWGTSIKHADGRHEVISPWHAQTTSTDNKKSWAPSTKAKK
jgi:outer membrane protein